MKRKPYKQFHCGKKFPKTPCKSKPFKWIPFSYIDTYHIATGRFRSRRKYGYNGTAYIDLDIAHDGYPRDHVHDIINGVRLGHRFPNKYERRELEKAKKKRRFL